MLTITKKSLVEFYLDYVNNFITSAYMANHYGIEDEECIYLIELGKKYWISKEF